MGQKISEAVVRCIVARQIGCDDLPRAAAKFSKATDPVRQGAKGSPHRLDVAVDVDVANVLLLHAPDLQQPAGVYGTNGSPTYHLV